MQFNSQLGDTIETTIVRLSQAIEWCSRAPESGDSALRTERLQPHLLAGAQKQVVESVAAQRFIELGHPQQRNKRTLQGGGLLIYQPDLNTSDGIAQSETNGFFDRHCTPPWDTWVAYLCESS